MIKVLAVFIGGGLGAVLRYAVTLWLYKPEHLINWGTFTSNIISSLILGVLLAALTQTDKSNIFYLLLATGLCGGFSTFSTFSAENFFMIQAQNWGGLAINILANTAVSLVAVFGGFKLGSLIGS